jgi:hypothetical protein
MGHSIMLLLSLLLLFLLLLPLLLLPLQVVCVDDGMPSWVCELCVHKHSVREAIAFVKQAEQDICFPIKQ